jgi:hypothetical protein
VCVCVNVCLFVCLSVCLFDSLVVWICFVDVFGLFFLVCLCCLFCSLCLLWLFGLVVCLFVLSCLLCFVLCLIRVEITIVCSRLLVVHHYHLPRRLCVGDTAVPTFEFDGHNFFKVASTANMTWLLRPLGLTKLIQLPTHNTLTLVKNTMVSLRGKKGKFTVRVDSGGQPQAPTVDIVVSGKTITVRNILQPLFIDASPDTIQWLMAVLKTDIENNPPTNTAFDSPNSKATTSTTMSIADSSAAGDDDDDNAGSDGESGAMSSAVQDLPDGVKWCPSRHSFKGTFPTAKHPCMFRIRKSMQKDTASSLAEILLQRRRVCCFVESGEIVENP